MKLEFLRQGVSKPIPRSYLARRLTSAQRLLQKQGHHRVNSSLILVFVEPSQMQSLNARFRKKRKPTDVLSFESGDPQVLGELVLCPTVIEKQAFDQGHSYREELLYMIIHGWLHLLGYEHEKVSEQTRKRMFELQDRLFLQVR